jgi:hypothetical protein
VGVRKSDRRKRPWSPIPASDGSLLIPLAGGVFAKIDAADLGHVRPHRWHTKRKLSQPGRIYAQFSIRLSPGRKGKRGSVVMHRFIVGATAGIVVDHINGDTLDNRRVNLRVTNARGNATNITSSKNQKRGGFKGVSWNKNAGKWAAIICAGEVKPNGKRKQMHLGLFVDPVDAARAYDAEAIARFGEFASLNFPHAEAAE